MLSVFGNKFLLIGRNLVNDKDRIRRANWHASAAIDATVGIYIELWRRFESAFVLLGVNAVGRTSFDAEFIFGAGISNNVCHDCGLPI